MVSGDKIIVLSWIGMKMCIRYILQQLYSSQWIDSNIKCAIFGGEKSFLKESYLTQAMKRESRSLSAVKPW